MLLDDNSTPLLGKLLTPGVLVFLKPSGFITTIYVPIVFITGFGSTEYVRSRLLFPHEFAQQMHRDQSITGLNL